MGPQRLSDPLRYDSLGVSGCGDGGGGGGGTGIGDGCGDGGGSDGGTGIGDGAAPAFGFGIFLGCAMMSCTGKGSQDRDSEEDGA
eukprot:5365257-Karenia_brevis.AAC.1